MRFLATLLALATLTINAQTPPPGDRHIDQLRFTLILSTPSAPPPAAALTCPTPSDIYIYSAAGTVAAARALTSNCPSVQIFTARPEPNQADPIFSANTASNLLAHILDTLQQAAGTPVSPAAIVTPVAAAQLAAAVTPTPPPTAAALASPAHAEVKADAQQPATTAPATSIERPRINGAFGPAGTKSVYLTGPEESLTRIASLLALTPTPGSQLIFELLQKHHKKSDLFPPWLIRISQRTASGATPIQTLNCKPKGCDLPVFLHAARAKVDPAQTTLDVPPSHPAP